MYAITDKCTGCHACKLVCPNKAVTITDEPSDKFVIQPHRCNGCVEQYDSPQCSSICPIEEAIVCSNGVPVNPKGSLSGHVPIQTM